MIMIMMLVVTDPSFIMVLLLCHLWRAIEGLYALNVILVQLKVGSGVNKYHSSSSAI